MENLDIITTCDGSHSLMNKTLDETYHSKHGAIQESKHVFISNGLEVAFHTFRNKTIRILEIGFGTGLNLFLTWEWLLKHNINIEYTTLELYPLPSIIWSKLNYADDGGVESKDLFQKIHSCEWNKPVAVSSSLLLVKRNISVEDLEDVHSYDLIYYDAFAPNKQPEMWTLLVLKKVIDSMAIPSIIVTYCAKGQFKRDLRSLGLKVESLEGPPGKKEMTRAIKE